MAFAPFVDGEPVVAGFNSVGCKQSYCAPGCVTKDPDCALIIVAAGVGNSVWRVPGSASKTSSDAVRTAPVNGGLPG